MEWLIPTLGNSANTDLIHQANGGSLTVDLTPTLKTNKQTNKLSIFNQNESTTASMIPSWAGHGTEKQRLPHESLTYVLHDWLGLGQQLHLLTPVESGYRNIFGKPSLSRSQPTYSYSAVFLILLHTPVKSYVVKWP